MSTSNRLSCLLLFAAAVALQPAFAQAVVSGRILNPKADEKIKLLRADYERFDHAEVGEFAVEADGSFKVDIPKGEPAVYYLVYDRKYRSIPAGNGQQISLKFDAGAEDSGYAAQGSAAIEEYLALRERQKALQEQYLGELEKTYEKIMEERKQAREGLTEEADLKAVDQKFQPRLDALDEQWEAADAEMNRELMADLQKVKSPLVIYTTMTRWNGEKYLPDYQALVANLQKQHPDSEVVQKMAAKVKRFEQTSIGATAPDILLADTTGKAQPLSSLRGQYVLVDFWASWCGPCRRENPNVVANYQQFKGRGFTVYGVSLDEEKEPWVKAIAKDELTWHHVSDLKGWSSEAGFAYNITGIPANLLIDPNGVIVAKNLRGEALKAKLAEVFAQK